MNPFLKSVKDRSEKTKQEIHKALKETNSEHQYGRPVKGRRRRKDIRLWPK